MLNRYRRAFLPASAVRGRAFFTPCTARRVLNAPRNETVADVCEFSELLVKCRLSSEALIHQRSANEGNYKGGGASGRRESRASVSAL